MEGELLKIQVIDTEGEMTSRSGGDEILHEMIAIQSIFQSLATASSSELTNSSTDQIKRVKKIFIHLHHIWDEWSSTTGGNNSKDPTPGRRESTYRGDENIL